MKLPEIIYRYINWSDKEAIKLLTERQILFYTADKWKNFGEYQFELTTASDEELFEEIEKIVETLRNKQPLVYEKWFNVHLKLYKIDFSKYNNLTFPENALFEQQTVSKIIENRIKEIKDRPQVYQRLLRIFYFKHTGILSTSMTTNSKSLWDWKKRYDSPPTDNVICVAIRLNCLRTKLDEVGNYSMGIVDYTGQTNKVDILASDKEALIKRYNSITHTLPEHIGKPIKDQMEFRIVKFLKSDISKKSSERFIIIDKSCIEKVIIHSQATVAVKEEVKRLAISNGWPTEEYLPPQ